MNYEAGHRYTDDPDLIGRWGVENSANAIMPDDYNYATKGEAKARAHALATSGKWGDCWPVYFADYRPSEDEMRRARVEDGMSDEQRERYGVKD